LAAHAGQVINQRQPLNGSHSNNLPITPQAPTPVRPTPGITPRLIGLTVTHGARKNARNPDKWDSYLFGREVPGKVGQLIATESIVVLATTDPNHPSVWAQIRWNSDGGRPVFTFPNGWSLPRNEQRAFHVSASLGGVTRSLTVTVETLVDLSGDDGNEQPGLTPINTLGTGRKINLYGANENKEFDDYAALKTYQREVHSFSHRTFIRPLTKAPVSAPPPDGPGLPDDCASDVCMRATPFYSPSFFAIARIRRKDHCRLTYASPSPGERQKFLDAFADASLIQNSGEAVVLEYPQEAIWSRPSNNETPTVPPPDIGFDDHKSRTNEGEP
jgi:hypothetical protein